MVFVRRPTLTARLFMVNLDQKPFRPLKACRHRPLVHPRRHVGQPHHNEQATILTPVARMLPEAQFTFVRRP